MRFVPVLKRPASPGRRASLVLPAAQRRAPRFGLGKVGLQRRLALGHLGLFAPEAGPRLLHEPLELRDELARRGDVRELEREGCYVGPKDASWPMYSCGNRAIKSLSGPDF